MTQRKRAQNDLGHFTADDPSTPDLNEAYEPALLPLDVESLAAFLQIEHPDRQRLATALDLASQAAAATIHRPITPQEPHAIRHGVHMLASQLLLADRLQEIPTTIPLVIRALWAQA